MSATAPHVLVVKQERCPDCTLLGPCEVCRDEPDLRYAIECPGVTDSCRTWWGCGQFSRSAVCLIHPHRYHDDDELVAHGQVHKHLDGAWHVSSHDCLAHTMDSALDSASELDRKPGRYEVDLDVEYDSIELSLRSVATPPVVGTVFATTDGQVHVVSRVARGFVGWCPIEKYRPLPTYVYGYAYASFSAHVDEWADAARPVPDGAAS